MSKATYVVSALLFASLWVAGCTVSSPALRDTEAALDPDQPAPPENPMEVREDGTGKAMRSSPDSAVEPCVDNAFLGSPDADVRPTTTPLPCWKAVFEARPSLKKDLEAGKQRLEERHQSFGQPLVEVEASACEGLSETEVALSPFYFSEDIVNVEPITQGDATVGVLVHFNAGVENLTSARMERIVNCHLARAKVICDPDTVDYCPLVLQDVKTRVKGDGETITVEVVGTSEAAGAAILERVKTFWPKEGAL